MIYLLNKFTFVFSVSAIIIRLIILLFVFKSDAFGSHVIGYDMNYKFVGFVPQTQSNKYLVTLRLYRDKMGIDCDGEFTFQVFYNDSARTFLKDFILTDPVKANLEIPFTGGGCSFDPGIEVEVCEYSNFLEIPNSINGLNGYHVVSGNCCRNSSITNIANPGSSSQVFYMFLAPNYFKNNSPYISDLTLPFFCINDSSSMLNYAYDPDGDKLIFSIVPTLETFSTSVNNNLILPFDTVTYASGYSSSAPFGINGSALIDSTTGISKYYSNIEGGFVLTVEIKEFRNDILIGIYHRVIQIFTVPCSPSAHPVSYSILYGGSNIYQVNPGDTLYFPIKYYDNYGDSVKLFFSGEVLDSSMIVIPPTILDKFSTIDSAGALIFWSTMFNQERELPYTLLVSAADNACPPRVTYDVYKIIVKPIIVNTPKQVTRNNDIQIIPNPNSGYTTIYFLESGRNHIWLTDLSGKNLLNRTFISENHKAEFNFNHLSKGIYLLNIASNNYKKVFKIIIN